VVCDPRKNALLKQGNKSDKIYLSLTQDATRVMSRIKAVYRGRGISCTGQKVYATRHRSEWLEELSEQRAGLPQQSHVSG
jgi:hypothetical protein